MKTKIIPKLLIIGIILAILIPLITYGNNTGGAFFSVDKLEVAPEEMITMKVDLTQVDYEEFVFTLSSNVNLSSVTTDDALDTSTSGNILKIAGNKSEIKMQEIDLYYQIPKELAVGTTITLTGKIEPVETEVETPEPQETATEKDSTEEANEIDLASQSMEGTEIQQEEQVTAQIPTENTSEVPNQETVKTSSPQEVTIIITIVETSTETSTNEIEGDFANKMEKEKMSNEQMEMDFEKMGKEKMQDTEEKTMVDTASKSGTSSETTVTYNGDSNNYLTSLTIEGYDLTPTFAKTSNTYFITVKNDVETLNITAVAEDSDAKVKIYGNEDLQIGTNKILISVTAENGDVRTYRIYVQKEA